MFCAWDSDKLYPTSLHSSGIVVTPSLYKNKAWHGIVISFSIKEKDLDSTVSQKDTPF